MKLHAESPVLHAESSCILHAKEFLLYFTWPLIVTLLRVQCHDIWLSLRKTESLVIQQGQGQIISFSLMLSLILGLLAHFFGIAVKKRSSHLTNLLCLVVVTCQLPKSHLIQNPRIHRSGLGISCNFHMSHQRRNQCMGNALVMCQEKPCFVLCSLIPHALDMFFLWALWYGKSPRSCKLI